MRPLVGILSILLSTSAAATSAEVTLKQDDDAGLTDVVVWALNPDGRSAAFVTRPPRGQAPQLLYADFGRGSLTAVPVSFAGEDRAANISAKWSPDGTRLAFFGRTDDRWSLRIWDRRDGRLVSVPDRPACVPTNASGCTSRSTVWAVDSSAVYFLAQPNGASSPAIHPPSESSADWQHRWRELLYADPRAGGVTVFEWPPVSASRSPVPIAPAPLADVLRADVQGRVTPVLSGKPIMSLSLSPNGRWLLAIASADVVGELRQSLSDYYLLSTSAPSRTGVHEPILSGVRQVWGPVAWASDSRAFAYAENGAAAAGDVFVFDLRSRKSRKLTASAPSREAGEEAVPRDPSAVTHMTPGAKFNEYAPLVWQADSRSILTLRRAWIEGTWRTRLWSISLDGTLTNLTSGWAWDAHLPSNPHAAGTLVPLSDGAGHLAFAELPEAGGHPPRLRLSLSGSFHASHAEQFPVAADGTILFVRESALEPLEGYRIRPGAQAPELVTHFNDRALRETRLPQLTRITWSDPHGRERFGYLIAGAHTGASAPLIVQIYPRYPYEFPLDMERFPGGLHNLLPPVRELLDAGYTVFLPDIPTAGQGHTCEEVTQNVERALDAIAARHSLDTSRAALIGHSFGGWAVNCVIGRSDRFKAAVSLAGASDLISIAFSPVASASSWGIGGGQTTIGANIWERPASYWEESPISRAPHIKTPLLLVHGKLDTSIPFSQSAEMYVALANQSKPVKLVGFDELDHGGIETSAIAYEHIVEWLDTHLGASRVSTK